MEKSPQADWASIYTAFSTARVIRQTGSKLFAHLYVFDAGFPKRRAKFVKAA